MPSERSWLMLLSGRRKLLLMIGLVLALAGGAWIAWASHVARVVEVHPDQRSATIGRVYFGGPDQPVGHLREILLKNVRAAPKGSSIDWATYLLIDGELADALIAASDRGVDVTLCLDGHPLLRGANDPVIAYLRKHAPRVRLTVRGRGWSPLVFIGGLHSKIFVFSHPRPVALVGSFDPSAGPKAGPQVFRAIGNHNRGHNLLVEITSPALVGALREHVRELSRNQCSASSLSPAQNRIYRDRDTELYFYPRMRPAVIEADVKRLGRGDRVWAAISHLSNVPLGAWTAASRRGAKLKLIVHDSERRVPERVIERLAQSGIKIRRYRHPQGLPMHAKFFLLERANERVSYFGSFNLNLSSRLFNQELLVRSTNPVLFQTLRARFDELENEVQHQQRSTGTTERLRRSANVVD